MHSTLVVDGEGVPLGVPQIQYEAPEAGGPKRKPAGSARPALGRRLRECARLASDWRGATVSVMDLEGDSFELFVEQRRLGTVDLLVRAQHNRRLGRECPSCSSGCGRRGRRRRWRSRWAPFGEAGDPSAEGQHRSGERA